MRQAIILALLLFSGFSSMAQEVYSSSGRPLSERNRSRQEPKGFDKDRLIFGGGFIFAAGSGFFSAGITPIIGYRISDRFAAGVGLGYRYFREKIPYDNIITGQLDLYTLKTSIYTGSIWGRFIVFNNFFVHFEPEVNSLERIEVGYDRQTFQFRAEKERIFVPSLLVGGGIRQPVSDRVSILTSILYDVLQDPNSPYLNTVDIRFGIVAGF